MSRQAEETSKETETVSIYTLDGVRKSNERIKLSCKLSQFQKSAENDETSQDNEIKSKEESNSNLTNHKTILKYSQNKILSKKIL